MFRLLAARPRSSRSSWGSSGASPTRVRIASTVPVLIREPNSCSQHSDDVAARDPVAHRQHGDCRVKARPKRAVAPHRRAARRAAGPAARAAHALQPMLGHDDVDRRQILDLMARRVAVGDPLRLREDVAAAPARRPSVMTNSSISHAGSSGRPLAHAALGRPACDRTGSCRAAAASPGGSWLGGCEELRDERFVSRFSCDPLAVARHPRRQGLHLRGKPLIYGPTAPTNTPTRPRVPARRSPRPRRAPRS